MQCVRGAQWKNMKEKQVKCTVTVCFTHLLAEDTMQLLRAYESLRMLKSHSFLLPPDRQTQTCVICVCVFDQCPIIYVEWLRRRFVSGVEISSLSLACLFRYFFVFYLSSPHHRLRWLFIHSIEYLSLSFSSDHMWKLVDNVQRLMCAQSHRALTIITFYYTYQHI